MTKETEKIITRKWAGLATLHEKQWSEIYTALFVDGYTIRNTREKVNFAIGYNTLSMVASHPEWDTYRKYKNGVTSVNLALKKARDARKARTSLKKTAKKDATVASAGMVELTKRVSQLESRVEAQEATTQRLVDRINQLANAIDKTTATPINTTPAAPKFDNQPTLSNNQTNEQQSKSKLTPKRKDAGAKPNFPWWK